MSCTKFHAETCHSGWVYGDSYARKHNGEFLKHTAVHPCPACRKGAHAVWQAGLMDNAEWDQNLEAMEVFCRAEGLDMAEYLRDRAMRRKGRK